MTFASRSVSVFGCCDMRFHRCMAHFLHTIRPGRKECHSFSCRSAPGRACFVGMLKTFRLRDLSGLSNSFLPGFRCAQVLPLLCRDTYTKMTHPRTKHTTSWNFLTKRTAFQ